MRSLLVQPTVQLSTYRLLQRCKISKCYSILNCLHSKFSSVLLVYVSLILQPNLQVLNGIISGFLFVCLICRGQSRGKKPGSVEKGIKRSCWVFINRKSFISTILKPNVCQCVCCKEKEPKSLERAVSRILVKSIFASTDGKS